MPCQVCQRRNLLARDIKHLCRPEHNSTQLPLPLGGEGGHLLIHRQAGVLLLTRFGCHILTKQQTWRSHTRRGTLAKQAVASRAAQLGARRALMVRSEEHVASLRP